MHIGYVHGPREHAAHHSNPLWKSYGFVICLTLFLRKRVSFGRSLYQQALCCSWQIVTARFSTRERCLRQPVTLLDGLTATHLPNPFFLDKDLRLQVRGVIVILFRISSPVSDRAMMYFDVVPISITLHSIFYGCR